MGLPVGKHIVPDKPLSVNEELVWDNGTPFPEPCIDRIADTIGKYEALAWLCGGLSFFASLDLLAVWNDKASKIPFEWIPDFSSRILSDCFHQGFPYLHDTRNFDSFRGWLESFPGCLCACL